MPYAPAATDQSAQIIMSTKDLRDNYAREDEDRAQESAQAASEAISGALAQMDERRSALNYSQGIAQALAEGGYIDEATMARFANEKDPHRLAGHLGTLQNILKEQQRFDYLNAQQQQLHNIWDYQRNNPMPGRSSGGGAAQPQPAYIPMPVFGGGIDFSQ